MNNHTKKVILLFIPAYLLIKGAVLLLYGIVGIQTASYAGAYPDFAFAHWAFAGFTLMLVGLLSVAICIWLPTDNTITTK